MNTAMETQELNPESHNVGAFSVNMEGRSADPVSGGEHILYSRGNLLEGVDYFKSLQQISELTRRNSQEVEELLLNGQRKKMRSSESLKSLVLLEAKFRGLGLDVYIESEKA